MMEREIKFRGKAKDDKWAIGYYLPWHAVRDTDGKDVYEQIFVEHQEEDEYISTGWIIVIDNTIGQYTGLKDKNGVEIYEGDIVRLHELDYIKVVRWDNEQCRFNMCDSFGNPVSGFNRDTMKEHKVIGNIYDNPELLNVEVEE